MLKNKRKKERIGSVDMEVKVDWTDSAYFEALRSHESLLDSSNNRHIYTFELRVLRLTAHLQPREESGGII